MGTVFNIQHFSIHDGPGIRTVVFLKGCPLRCKWCANPESQKIKKEIGWTKESCIGCNSCVSKLKDYSVRFEEDRLYWDTETEVERDLIHRTCPSEALHVIGKEMSVKDVILEVEKDWQFYLSSGGGITISGGEPLLQGDFTYEILRSAGKRQIHRTIETSAYSDYETFKRVASETDFLLSDIKAMDDDIHKEWTGVSNERILYNLKKIREDIPDLHIQIRTPVIPGVNDSEEELKKIIDFVNDIKADYELLKYHRFGLPKYESLNRTYPLGDILLSEDKFLSLEAFAIQRFSEGNTKMHYGKARVDDIRISMPEFSEGAGI